MQAIEAKAAIRKVTDRSHTKDTGRGSRVRKEKENDLSVAKEVTAQMMAIWGQGADTGVPGTDLQVGKKAIVVSGMLTRSTTQNGKPLNLHLVPMEAGP